MIDTIQNKEQAMSYVLFQLSDKISRDDFIQWAQGFVDFTECISVRRDTFYQHTTRSTSCFLVRDSAWSEIVKHSGYVEVCYGVTHISSCIRMHTTFEYASGHREYKGRLEAVSREVAEQEGSYLTNLATNQCYVTVKGGTNVCNT